MDNQPDTKPQEQPQPEMKKASELDIGWLNGSCVSSLSGPFEEVKAQELGIDHQEKMEFAWFAVKAKNSDSSQEELEKKEAIRRQIEMGIIKPNGLPVGWKQAPTDMKRTQGADRVLPPEQPSDAQKQEGPKKTPGGKLGRKILRERDRAIQKDMNKLIREETRKNKNSLAAKLDALTNTRPIRNPNSI